VNDGIAHIDGNGIGAIAGAHRSKTLFDQIEGFVPTDRHEAAVGRSFQRGAQPIRIMMHLADRYALGANVASQEWIVLVATDRNDAIAIELEFQPAHGLAEGASPEDCAQHGHGVTRDPPAASNAHDTLEKVQESIYLLTRPLPALARPFCLADMLAISKVQLNCEPALVAPPEAALESPPCVM
jgi:hypothetical protein